MFSNLAKDSHLKRSDKWNDEAKAAWDFLHSPEVIRLKTNLLKRIRDKSTFHIDPQPIKSFLNDELTRHDTLTLWTDETNDCGFSVTAVAIIGKHIYDYSSSHDDVPDLLTKIYQSLVIVSSATFQYLFDCKIMP